MTLPLGSVIDGSHTSRVPRLDAPKLANLPGCTAAKAPRHALFSDTASKRRSYSYSRMKTGSEERRGSTPDGVAGARNDIRIDFPTSSQRAFRPGWLTVPPGVVNGRFPPGCPGPLTRAHATWRRAVAQAAL